MSAAAHARLVSYLCLAIQSLMYSGSEVASVGFWQFCSMFETHGPWFGCGEEPVSVSLLESVAWVHDGWPGNDSLLKFRSKHIRRSRLVWQTFATEFLPTRSCPYSFYTSLQSSRSRTSWASQASLPPWLLTEKTAHFVVQARLSGRPSL